jgi:hypothetical protein
MSIGDRIGIGRGGPGWHWPRVRLHRPTGIRNGGLLLILVALAAVLALVDQPLQPGTGRRLPGMFQYLPPPVGITLTPPVTDQPLPAAGPTAAPAADGERPASGDRAHPRRAPSPSRRCRVRGQWVLGRPRVGLRDRAGRGSGWVGVRWVGWVRWVRWVGVGWVGATGDHATGGHAAGHHPGGPRAGTVGLGPG